MSGPALPPLAAPPPEPGGVTGRGSRRRPSTRAFTLTALGVALLVACGLSLWASSHPDGLEFVADAFGFLPAAQDSPTAAGPLAGYQLAAVTQPWLSVALAGALGCAATFGLAWLVSRAANPRRVPTTPRPEK